MRTKRMKGSVAAIGLCMIASAYNEPAEASLGGDIGKQIGTLIDPNLGKPLGQFFGDLIWEFFGFSKKSSGGAGGAQYQLSPVTGYFAVGKAGTDNGLPLS